MARSTVWHGFGAKVREEVSREVATLRRDVEEQALIIEGKMYGGSVDLLI